MTLFVAGVSHQTAAVEFREKVAVEVGKVFCTGFRLKHRSGLSELVILSTCNRVELYGVTNGPAGDLFRFLQLIFPASEDPQSHFYVLKGADAVAHLIKVTSGLDSMVLGETDVQRQVKDAYDKAHRAGLTGRVLNLVFQKALHAAKEIRTHTTIGVGTTSVASVAVSLASKMLGDRFSEATVLLIGAGQMASTCLRHFVKCGVTSFLIANRSPERSRNLIDEFGGRTVPLDDLASGLVQADIVVSATGAPGYILDRKSVEAARRASGRRCQFLIDIAVPRDIDPDLRHVDGVFLFDVDDLETLVKSNLKDREAELHACDAIIAENVHRMMARLTSLEARGDIAGRRPRVRHHGLEVPTL